MLVGNGTVPAGSPAWTAFEGFIRAIDDHLETQKQPPAPFSSVIFELGFGYTQGIGDIDFGPTQSIDQQGGLGLDFSVQTPLYVQGDFRLMIGAQGFGGQTDNKTLINQAPFPSSPLGGKTRYWGGGVLVGADYRFNDRFTLNGNFTFGAMNVDFSAVQGGVTVVTGDETVVAVRGGLGAYYDIGSGVSLGAGVSYTHIGDYDTTTNTGVILKAGGIRDWAATMRLRFELGWQCAVSSRLVT